MRGAFPLSQPGHQAAFPPLPRSHPIADEACAGFAAGTAILTTEGQVLAENLAPGDTAILAGGATATIRSITRRLARGGKNRPIRIQPGALGQGLPTRQLTVSPGVALRIGHVLIQAADLIDNATIFQDNAIPAIEYFTIELATTGILIAEGAAATTHADTGGPGSSPAPLCQSGPTLAAIRARLAARRRGFGLAAVETLALSARAAGRTLTPVLNASREAIFAIPAGATELLVTTPSFTPADFDPASTDRRRVGLALTAITIDGQTIRPETIAASGLQTRAATAPHAWTTGPLRLKLPPGTRRVTLHIAARPKTWLFRPKAA